jgi:hypothetical protein
LSDSIGAAPSAVESPEIESEFREFGLQSGEIGGRFAVEGAQKSGVVGRPD